MYSARRPKNKRDEHYPTTLLLPAPAGGPSSILGGLPDRGGVVVEHRRVYGPVPLAGSVRDGARRRVRRRSHCPSRRVGEEGGGRQSNGNNNSRRRSRSRSQHQHRSTHRRSVRRVQGSSSHSMRRQGRRRRHPLLSVRHQSIDLRRHARPHSLDTSERRFVVGVRRGGARPRGAVRDVYGEARRGRNDLGSACGEGIRVSRSDQHHACTKLHRHSDDIGERSMGILFRTRVSLFLHGRSIVRIQGLYRPGVRTADPRNALQRSVGGPFVAVSPFAHVFEGL
mmetsp:Transcript_29189/g.86415  ORF Transcript_29189/g.86415 Transcript_29189/m.86415 type:complete len:282 (-) Transcript_29189:823-1668(-)